MQYKQLAGLPITIAVLCVVVALWLIYLKYNDGAIHFATPNQNTQNQQNFPNRLAQTNATFPNRLAQTSATFPNRLAQTSAINPHYALTPNIGVLPNISFKNRNVQNLATVSNSHMPLLYNTTNNTQERVKQFTFSSVNRDIIVYPTSSNYKLQIPILLRNVIGITVQSAVLPRSEYNVNKFEQYLDIYIPFTNITYSIQLPVGTYDTNGIVFNDFTIALQNAITALPDLVTFTVTYNTLTGKIQLQSNNATAFQLLFKTGPNQAVSMCNQMGFPREDTLPSADITAPYMIDLTGTTTINVYIDEVQAALENEPVASIHLKPQKPYTVYMAELKKRQYFWPIGKVAFITLRFVVTGKNGDHRLYDFNGMNNTINLEFTYLQYKNVLENEIELDPAS